MRDAEGSTKPSADRPTTIAAERLAEERAAQARILRNMKREQKLHDACLPAALRAFAGVIGPIRPISPIPPAAAIFPARGASRGR